MAFFQRHYSVTMSSVTHHADGQRFTRCENSCLLENTVEANPFLMWTDSAEPEYPGKIQTQDQPEFVRNRQSFSCFSVKLSIRNNFFLLIWTAFTTSFSLVKFKYKFLVPFSWYWWSIIFKGQTLLKFQFSEGRRRADFFLRIVPIYWQKLMKKVWGCISRQNRKYVNYLEYTEALFKMLFFSYPTALIFAQKVCFW